MEEEYRDGANDKYKCSKKNRRPSKSNGSKKEQQ